MAKKQPPGTVGHTIFLPETLHKQLTTLADYGKADDLLIECLTEAIKPRWAKWIKKQNDKLG